MDVFPTYLHYYVCSTSGLGTMVSCKVVNMGTPNLTSGPKTTGPCQPAPASLHTQAKPKFPHTKTPLPSQFTWDGYPLWHSCQEQTAGPTSDLTSLIDSGFPQIRNRWGTPCPDSAAARLGHWRLSPQCPGSKASEPVRTRRIAQLIPIPCENRRQEKGDKNIHPISISMDILGSFFSQGSQLGNSTVINN